ncbi:carboxypeptidase regulatory-like domain-containing protein [Corallococcus exiguus]|uniref:carboxypeptidase-like regulatory domain-containing protein n=1 Tax=Corallococcus exiguus TaxID=83462 RepID=UPI001A8D0A68|nr:carboxypeptidase-like regulatory domain-containing protein [Corallococcus exiguus]MBN8469209.1 carboxypeptidase regulatory-like domain-containing protein [Corallococcus exiguus]
MKPWLGGAALAVVALLVFLLWRSQDASSPKGSAPSLDASAASLVARPTRLTTAPGSTGTARITGRVLGTHGPAGGVRVSASRAEPEVTLSERACPPSDDASDAAPRRLMQCSDEAFDELVDQVDKREGEAPTVAETTSAEDGTFILEGLPDGTVTLQASSGQDVAMRPDVTTGQQDVVLVLEEGAFFEGIVLDGPTGTEPIEGARVTVFSHEHTRFFPATSGANGRYRIGPVPPADYGILVTASGRGPNLRMRADPLEEDTFILDRPAKYAGTVVTAKGAPATGVSVRLYTPSAAPESRTALTDAQGRFSFPSFEDVPGQLFAETAAQDGLAHLRTAPREDIVLTLGPGMVLRGTISDEGGRPIPGARVMADLWDANTPSPRGQTVTDAKGHYRLGPLFRLPHFVAVRAVHYTDVEPEHQQLGDVQETLDFTLPRAVSVEGVVVDEAGKPLAGREVRLHPEPTPDPTMDLVTDHTQTDEAGRFTLDAVEAGTVWLDVDDATFVPQRFAVELPSRDTRLVLRRGVSVSVTVLSALGAPVRNAQVKLWKRDARGESDHDGATDAHGQVTLQGVPPGRYVAEATVRERAVDVQAAQPLEVQEGAPTSATLRLEEGRTLRGVVVSPQGLPLSGVAVRAELLDAERPRYRGEPSSISVFPDGVRTDAEGRFTLRSLSAARYVLSARHPGHVLDTSLSPSLGPAPGEEKTVVVRGDTEEVRLVLRRIPHVRGRVVAEGGATLEWFEVNGTRYTQPDGLFDKALYEATGPQRFVVRAKGFATVDRTVTPDGENDVDLGTLTLTQGRTVRVLLRDAATGEPFTGRVRGDSGQWATIATGYRIHGEGVADGPPYLPATGAVPRKDGSLLLENLPTTAFTLEVDTQLHLPTRATVGAAEDSITLSLDSGARVTGHVRDAQGQPVDVQLTFTRSDGLTLQRHPSAGAFILRAIPPGLYTVNAWMENGPRDTVFPPRTVRVPPSGDVTLTFDALGTGATVTLRLPEDVDTAFLLSGQAPAPDSARAFEHLSLQQYPGEEWTGTSVTFRRVPAGHYTVIAGNRGKDRIHREELDVPAEGTLSRDVKPVWMPLAR